jgi:hypothetical protein
LPDLANFPRVHRCVLHLANGNLDELKTAAKSAGEDYRDVMIWAERDDENHMAFDFRQTFDLAEEPRED